MGFWALNSYASNFVQMNLDKMIMNWFLLVSCLIPPQSKFLYKYRKKIQEMEVLIFWLIELPIFMQLYMYISLVMEYHVMGIKKIAVGFLFQDVLLVHAGIEWEFCSIIY